MQSISTIFLFLLTVFISSCSGSGGRQIQNQDAVPDQEKGQVTSDVQRSGTKETVVSPDLQNRKRHEASFVLENYLVTKIPTINYTEINTEAVIFYQPDAKEIKAYKKEFGEESFYTVSDDNLYYAYEAEVFLEQRKIRAVYPDTRYLKFKLNDNGKYLLFDAKSDANLGWTTILFKPGSAPKIINPADIEEESKMYFGK